MNGVQVHYICHSIDFVSLASRSKCPLGLTPMEISRNRVLSSQDLNVCTVAMLGRSPILTTANVFDPKFLLITQTPTGHAGAALQVPYSPGLTAQCFTSVSAPCRLLAALSALGREGIVDSGYQSFV